MDLKNNIQPPSPSQSHRGVKRVSVSKANNIKEAAAFGIGSKKNPVPSKWNDAEKWLVHSTTKHQNHNHNNGFVKPAADCVSRKSGSSNAAFGIQAKVISEEKVSIIAENQNHQNSSSDSSFHDVVLKETETDKQVLTDADILKFECLGESFMFKETPVRGIGSSTFKASSPPRHNTPAARSGRLDPNTSSFDMLQLANLTSNWTSREEEEADSSKCLTHFDECSSMEKKKTNSCCCSLRYQREEAKIQAWVNLQYAKAEAQSRKFEVKIQKMRSNFEEKMMRKMTVVDKKAVELRAAAQLQHTEKLNQNHNHFSGHNHSCGCFPCNNNLHP